MTKFHDFDPWDFLNELNQTQIRQAQHISTIIQAHNETQRQVHELQQERSRLALEILQLQHQILELDVNIKKDFPNG